MEVQIHSFIYSALVEMSGQLHTPTALPQEKEPQASKNKAYTKKPTHVSQRKKQNPCEI